jgi:hypothetical protein
MKGSAASPLVWPDRQDEKIPVDLKSGTHPVRWALALFALALIPRLLGLRLFLTSDEHTNLYWAGSQFVEGLLSGNLALTYWHFYPGVTMSWVETLGLVAAWALHWLNGGTAETLAQFVRRPILELIVDGRRRCRVLPAGTAILRTPDGIVRRVVHCL